MIIHNWLFKLSKTKQIIIFTTLAIVLKVPFILAMAQILDMLNLAHIEIFSSNIQIPSITVPDFLLGVVVAPIVETFLAQYVPIQLAKKAFLSNFYVVLISATAFAILHLPVIEFVPGAFVVGLVLAYFYLIRLNTKGTKDAFLSTSLVHALHNLVAFIVTATLV
jgi:hypothetical protein